MRQSTDTAGNGTIAVDFSKPLEKGGGADLGRQVGLCMLVW